MISHRSLGPRTLTRVLLLTAMLAGAGVALAQDGRPVRLIVGFAAGGSIDAGARVIAPLLEADLKQPVIVDNKPGGNGVVAVQSLMGAPADGNSLYMQSTSVTTRVFIKDFQVDVLRDFQPVAPLWTVSYFLVTSAALPGTTVAQFVDAVKARKGLNYAAGTASGMLTMETLKWRTGIDLLQVPYKGSAPAAVALLANDVQATFDTIGVWKQHVDAGKVRILLYTGKERNAVMPNVPTAAEAGMPELQVALTGGLWARGGAPAAQVERLNAAVNRVVARADVRQKFADIGWGTIGGTPAELRNQVAAEMGFWERAAKLVNYKPE